jgi:TRAP-type C4-dicarboxylate transport system permease small subunit
MAAGRSSGPGTTMWARTIAAVRAVIVYWALFGGLILAGLVLMTAASALSNLWLNRPFPGDYEIVKHGVAIAVFAFLPYCQIAHANVTVDIFTEGMGDRAKASMALFSSLIAAGLAALLLRQMWLGMFDYLEYREVMVSLPIPLWTAFPPALVSLALLFVAALITAGEGLASLRQGAQSA